VQLSSQDIFSALIIFCLFASFSIFLIDFYQTNEAQAKILDDSAQALRFSNLIAGTINSENMAEIENLVNVLAGQNIFLMVELRAIDGQTLWAFPQNYLLSRDGLTQISLLVPFREKAEVSEQKLAELVVYWRGK
jgi:hypothetical protein